MAGIDAHKEKEVYCQQVLQPDRSVFSVQWMVLPREAAHELTPAELLTRYLAFLKRHTLGVVRPTEVAGGGIEFRVLFLPLSLLSFGEPRYLFGKDSSAVHLAVCGGILARKKESRLGVFSLILADHHDDVRVSVHLSHFRPRLLGRGTSHFRRLLYRFTQASAHKESCVTFLLKLHEELTGEKVRARMMPARVRVGQDI